MPTGELLGWFLLGLAVVWGVIDFVVWKKGGQTFSQWVIEESKKRFTFWLLTVMIIVGFAIWLILHWELPETFMEYMQ